MDPLQAGIMAARQGQRAEARALLKKALQTDLSNEPAWLWLSTVVETGAERRMCLERALAINPQNQSARAEMERLAASDSLALGGMAIYRLPPLQPQNNGPSMPLPTTTPPAQTQSLPVIRPLSPQPLPEMAPDSAISNPHPIRRLPPHLAPVEEEIPPLGNGLLPHGSTSAAPASQSGPLIGLALAGCLSVTAISGLLVLFALWLIGWPP